MSEDYYKDIFVNQTEDSLDFFAKKVAYTIIQTPHVDNEESIERYTSLNCELTDNNIFMNRILCDFDRKYPCTSL